jgi:hypothetical protein
MSASVGVRMGVKSEADISHLAIDLSSEAT